MIVKRVADIARHAPTSLALQDTRFSLTFEELDACADRLAAHLSAAGVGPEVLVGLFLTRSCDRIAANLAIWKSGGAVLPLDPDWPDAYVARVLAESAAPILITTKSVVPKFEVRGLACVAIDDDSRIPRLPEARSFEMASIAQDSLAYVVYTSGSTGTPKGVEITHGNLQGLIAWHQETFCLQPEDRISHVAGLGYDAAFWEIWPALCAGASVAMPDETSRSNPDLLRRWLCEQQITVAFAPTAFAERLISTVWPRETRLRILLTGGETLRYRPIPGLPFKLVNNYGPSECTVVATSGNIETDAGDDYEDIIDIGYPIAQTRILILDHDGNQVPRGIPGEIAVAGPSVGRGYRGRPDLTKQRFPPDRSTSFPGGRLFLTGDAGRILPDGRVVFLGRLDEQEKVRGERVEPEGVASALLRHPAIGWCAVVGDGPVGARRLIAYVLVVAPLPPRAEELQAFIRLSLPEAAVPSEFLHVATVPLSANGKVDRAALKRVEATPLPRESFRFPETQAEMRVATIISAVLGLAQIGADDNFFLLGGQSLMAAQVLMRLRDATGVQLSLRDLFELQTVARIATVIEDRLTEKLLLMTDEEATRWIS